MLEFENFLTYNLIFEIFALLCGIAIIFAILWMVKIMSSNLGFAEESVSKKETKVWRERDNEKKNIETTNPTTENAPRNTSELLDSKQEESNISVNTAKRSIFQAAGGRWGLTILVMVMLLLATFCIVAAIVNHFGIQAGIQDKALQHDVYFDPTLKTKRDIYLQSNDSLQRLVSQKESDYLTIKRERDSFFLITRTQAKQRRIKQVKTNGSYEDWLIKFRHRKIHMQP